MKGNLAAATIEEQFNRWSESRDATLAKVSFLNARTEDLVSFAASPMADGVYDLATIQASREQLLTIDAGTREALRAELSKQSPRPRQEASRAVASSHAGVRNGYFNGEASRLTAMKLGAALLYGR